MGLVSKETGGLQSIVEPWPFSFTGDNLQYVPF
jgi:hypothetical protein